MISENLPVVTMMTAPAEYNEKWYEQFDDVYDSENCLFDKKVYADHRNQIKLHKGDMLLAALKVPENTAEDA